jgi:hypothetical protein
VKIMAWNGNMKTEKWKTIWKIISKELNEANEESETENWKPAENINSNKMTDEKANMKIFEKPM